MKNKHELIISSDGSHTLYVPELNEHYHSTNGAVNESMHVFIEAGLNQLTCDKINVLEFGFGTGLNAFLTSIHNNKKEIHYDTMEKYPLEPEFVNQLNYGDLYEGKYQKQFKAIHQCKWEQNTEVHSTFNLTKLHCDFKDLNQVAKYNLIYFDAFAPDIQPKLWTKEIFEKAYNALLPGGILTTYCAKGVVRRTMQEVGFTVERIPGPAGKREMLRAIK